jgi:hypothetical protein
LYQRPRRRRVAKSNRRPIVEASKKVGWRERLRARRANNRAKAADRATRRGADRAPTERQDDVKFGQLGGYAGDRKQGGRL